MILLKSNTFVLGLKVPRSEVQRFRVEGLKGRESRKIRRWEGVIS
jgi:hypothetical protein